MLPGREPRMLLWPQARLHLPSPGPGQKATLQVTAASPWAHLLLTVNGEAIYPERRWSNPGDGP